MPMIVMGNMQQKLEKVVRLKLFAFLEKLQKDDELPGLHIEPMVNAADSRARTGRVDQGLRAVLYRIDAPSNPTMYICAGVYEHDEAIKIAKTQILRVNPVNGVTELINGSAPETPAPVLAADSVADAHEVTAATFLAQFGYSMDDLIDELGFDAPVASRLLRAHDEDAYLGEASALPNQWQQNAALDLAVGKPLDVIRSSLGLGTQVAPEDGSAASDDQLSVEEATTSSDEALVASLQRPASQMQFTFIEDNDELRRVIEGGDFGAWRVFLHPEQRAYATRSYNGPFRLTGGAGTGKTVVLLHRARALAKANPTARVLLTTFTRVLAEMLSRDLERLDPTVHRADALGAPGIRTSGIDQIAWAVRERMTEADWEWASHHVLGGMLSHRAQVAADTNGWEDAIFDAGVGLPDELASAAFFESEYQQIVLPNLVTSQSAYFAVRRVGRGIALDRAKRAQVWTVIDRYRSNARTRNHVTWAELSSIAAAHLNANPDARPADHVLVDEAQDLTPSHWTMLRALTGEHPNDLFIAEDSHQRIYGQRVTLSRFGIKITGRSRRLSLNYRTTQQNLRYALGVLEGADYVNSDGETEDEHGYRSARRGPDVTVRSFATPAAQYDGLAEVLRGWGPSGADSESIAVLVRTRKAAEATVQQLATRSVKASDKTAAKQIRVLTMHSAKGLEFSRVVLFDVSDGVVPNKYTLAKAALDERDDVLLRERSLLYVAATRARDELVVSWQGRPSPLLTPEVASGAMARRSGR